jgi:hypothetical protein
VQLHAFFMSCDEQLQGNSFACMKEKEITANRIPIGGNRVHHVRYVQYLAANLPQFEGVNHKSNLKRIYRLQGNKAVERYIKRSYLRYRAELRKKGKYGNFWAWYYEIVYGI